MSSSFSSVVASDASGPAGGADSIIYKNKPEHAHLYTATYLEEEIFPKGTKREELCKTASS